MKKYYRGTINAQDAQCCSAQHTVLVANSGECTTCFMAYADIKKQSLLDSFASPLRLQAHEGVKKCPWPCLLPCFCDNNHGH